MNYKNSRGEKVEREGFKYEPNLAYVPSEKDNVWYATKGSNWVKVKKITFDKPKSYENLMMRKYHDKYLVPSLKIVLSN